MYCEARPLLPLIHGTSDEARSANIAAEIDAGRSPEQAAAIGYSVQRQAKKTHSDGDSAGNHVSDDARVDRPAVCEIRNWRVFGPGWHKQKFYYPPADIDRIPANFARLSTGSAPTILATGKLGHDPGQRFAESLGFLGNGRIAEVGQDPDGILVIRRMVGVPRLIGAAINAGLLPSGSVELIDSHPDPADPAETIQGPILTGVSFLGEEPPAVKGLGSPKAVYADGRPVEPLDDEEFKHLLRGMVEARDKPRKFADYAGRAVHSIAFSEMFTRSPMTPDALIQALQALPQDQPVTPEQLQQLMGAAPANQTMTEVPATSVDTPTQPDAVMSDAYKKAFADCRKMFAEEMEKKEKEFSALTKRFGDLEAAEKARQEKAESTEMSAAFTRAAAVVDRAINPGPGLPPRLLPIDRDAHIAVGVQTLKTKAFNDIAGDGERAFAAWADTMDRRPTVVPTARLPEKGQRPDLLRQVDEVLATSASGRQLLKLTPPDRRVVRTA